MTAQTNLKLFLALFLFTIGSFAQSLLEVLRREGFKQWATVLESPRNAGILSYPDNLIIFAPTNAALARQLLSGSINRRQPSIQDILAALGAVPESGNKGNYKRHKPTCNPDIAGPGTEDLMTLLNDPRFVNLPLDQNASIVQKNMPKGTLPIVLTGLGNTVRVIAQDIPFDKGVIRPISGWFTLPKLLSETLPFLAADNVLGVLERTGLIDDFDNRTGITFLAPEDQAIPSNLADDVLADILRRHLIVDLPTFTSDMNHGDSFRTLAGTTVTVTIQCGEVSIGGAKILSGDTIIKNGVVHIVDSLVEAPIVVTTTQVQTVTETVKVVETSIETTTQTAMQTETQTVEVPVPETTTATETVTPCLQSTASTTDNAPSSDAATFSEPEMTTSSLALPPSITSSVLPVSPPALSGGSSVPTPPPVLASSSSPDIAIPPQTPASSSTPLITSSSSLSPPSSSVWTLPASSTTSENSEPPMSSPLQQSSSSISDGTPCTESTSSTTSSVYIVWSSKSVPPVYPTYPVYSLSTSPDAVEPSSTPCDSEETPTMASSSWMIYSSTTLATSQRSISSAPPPPVYEPVLAASSSPSEAYPTSIGYGGHGAGEY